MTFEESVQMRLLDPGVFNEYVKNDARHTFRLWQKFAPEIDRQGLRQVYELEKAIVPVVIAMEERGMLLDIANLGAMADRVNVEIARISKEVFDHAGCRFDLNSQAKVAAILYDKLGVPSGKQTNSGQRSVDKETLEDVRGYHPAVDAI